MADYNYIDIETIIDAVKSLETHSTCTVFTSHGDEITFSRFYDEFVAVDREHSHCICDNMAEVIRNCFVDDRMRLRCKVFGFRVHLKWYELVYCNNPRHPWYKQLVYVADDEYIAMLCKPIAFWWDAENVPDGIEYGVKEL